MNRESAFELLKQHVHTPANIAHALEAEAVMRAMAKRLGQDQNKWGICGLLHDLDWELTQLNPAKHGLVTAEMLAATDIDPDILAAIPAHNGDLNGSVCDTQMAKALMPSETVTGLVIACILVRPDRNFATLQVSSIRKKMKDKSFARNVSRETIMKVEELGIPLEEFLELAKNAIAEIQSSLSL
ncbi:MAG: HDIG domain-containing metalloprotein [Candidatus Brocadiia bacterium]